MKSYRFCPYCGGQTKTKYIAEEEQERTVCTPCDERFYYNSIPCVGALIVDRNRVLLVKRNQTPFKGYWDIPGGFLEAGEHPEKGIMREVFEETGLRVKLNEILGIFMDKYGRKRKDTLNIYYIAKIIGGEMRAGSDAAALKWFSKNNLPKRIAFRNGRQALEAWQNRKYSLGGFIPIS